MADRVIGSPDHVLLGERKGTWNRAVRAALLPVCDRLYDVQRHSADRSGDAYERPEAAPDGRRLSTAYNYLVPMILNIVITVILLPKYGNVYSVEMFAASCIVCVAVSGVGLLLCSIAVSDIDKPENFVGVASKKKAEPVKVKDMWSWSIQPCAADVHRCGKFG